MDKTASKNAIPLMPIYVRCNVSFVILNPIRWFKFLGCISAIAPAVPFNKHLKWFSRSVCVKIRALPPILSSSLFSLFSLLFFSVLYVCLVSDFDLDITFGDCCREPLDCNCEGVFFVYERV